MSDLERRKSVRLGRRFAGAIAVRLDAHPGSVDGPRVESEKRILAMAREVLGQREPEPAAVNFLTHAVEVHTESFGFSKMIYDEMFKLHEARIKKVPVKTSAPAVGKLDPARFMVGRIRG